jgi:hypothetical protein
MAQVSVATPAHIKDAAHTIVQAFLGDPFNLYLYNYIADQDHPPWGTEEMMALRIWLTMVSELVLVVEDGDSRCAGVALWEPPQSEPLSWGVWARVTARSMYMRLACLYYGSRGVNLKVFAPRL